MECRDVCVLVGHCTSRSVVQTTDPPPPDLRIFRLVTFLFLGNEIGMATVLKSAPNFSLRESKRNVIKVVGRILLGYSIGGLAVILLSIRFQCAGT